MGICESFPTRCDKCYNIHIESGKTRKDYDYSTLAAMPVISTTRWFARAPPIPAPTVDNWHESKIEALEEVGIKSGTYRGLQRIYYWCDLCHNDLLNSKPRLLTLGITIPWELFQYRKEGYMTHIK